MDRYNFSANFEYPAPAVRSANEPDKIRKVGTRWYTARLSRSSRCFHVPALARGCNALWITLAAWSRRLSTWSSLLRAEKWRDLRNFLQFVCTVRFVYFQLPRVRRGDDFNSHIALRRNAENLVALLVPAYEWTYVRILQRETRWWEHQQLTEAKSGWRGSILPDGRRGQSFI